MHPFAVALTVEHWLYLALGVVGAVLAVWALVDCLLRSPDQFLRAGQRQKSFWLILTVLAAVIAVMSVWSSLSGFSAGFGLFQILALCVASVYLAGPRAELQSYGGSAGRSNY